jgi:hypothetical protein
VLGYGLGALTKPLFALAGGAGLVVAARLLDRVGKGIRGAPRDALVADIAPPHARRGLRPAPVARHRGRLRRPAAGHRPDAAVGDDFRAVFWVATVPAWAAVALLASGSRSRRRPRHAALPDPA